MSIFTLKIFFGGTTMGIDLKQWKFINLFKIFIISQPILDILTYFSIVYLQLNLTGGIIVRVLFIGVSLFYICFGNQHPWKKYIVTYIAILFIILGIGFVFHFITKPEFYIFTEVQFLIKTIYFPVMICTILLLFPPNSQMAHFNKNILSSVSIAMVIVGLSMLIAVLTNTSNTTYKPDYFKTGYIGWFFAGNEIGAIVAIAFPLVLIYSISKTKQLKDAIYWIPTLLLAISALLIGTKVSYLAITITIMLSLVINLIYWILDLTNAKHNKTTKKVFLLNLALVIIFFVITPYSPTYSNMKAEYDSINEIVQEERTIHQIEEMNQSKGHHLEEDSILKSRVFNILLSSRDTYFYPIYMDYKNSNFVNKLFGLGYAGYYESEPKLIEMDFFDLFFSYGLLGFLVLFLPLFYILWTVIRLFFTNIKAFFQIDYILLLISVGLSLGVAFFAGHVLFAPAVSIYLAIALVLLFYSSYHNTRIKN